MLLPGSPGGMVPVWGVSPGVWAAAHWEALVPGPGGLGVHIGAELPTPLLDVADMLPGGWGCPGVGCRTGLLITFGGRVGGRALRAKLLLPHLGSHV